MAVNYPTSIDSFTDPLSSDEVSAVSHSSQHTDHNTAIEALETKLGTGSSTATANTVLRGTGSGSTTYGKLVLADIDSSDVSGADDTLISGTAGTNGNLSQWNSDGDLVDTSLVAANVIQIADISDGSKVDGDKIDIDWNPANYTPTDVTETDDTDDLSAHLKGIDLALADVGAAVVTDYINTCMGLPALTDDSIQLNSNTVAHVSLFNLPQEINVNTIKINVVTVGTGGTFDIAIFSEDGQTQHLSETTTTISGTGLHTHTLSSELNLPPDNYYFYLAPNSTTDLTVRSFNPSSGLAAFTDESPAYAGTYTVTADTVPSTITPSSVSTATHNEFIGFRLEN